MKKLLFAILVIAQPIILTSQVSNTCVTSQEMELYNLIISYRKQNGLTTIPLSKSLTFVAQAHVKDLQNNHPDEGKCNLHSWSDMGEWSACCYTPDHKQAKCMWDKPKELTSYTSNGFEISAFSGGTIDPVTALDLWKNSVHHNNVILNEDIWKPNNWKAIGIGIYGSYAVVWFGTAEDTEGIPSVCK